MLKNCCFCISLRTATLILSVWGMFSHFYSAICMANVMELDNNGNWAMSAITAYSWLAGVAYLAGFLGVLRNNVSYLRIFSICYWVDLALSLFSVVVFSLVAFTISNDVCTQILSVPEQELDMETCLKTYIATCLTVVVAMGLSLLLTLHYALAVHAYYLTVKHQMQQHISLPENTYIPVLSFGTYSSVPQSEARVDPEDSDDEEASLPPAYSPASVYPGEGTKTGGIKI